MQTCSRRCSLCGGLCALSKYHNSASKTSIESSHWHITQLPRLHTPPHPRNQRFLPRTGRPHDGREHPSRIRKWVPHSTFAADMGFAEGKQALEVEKHPVEHEAKTTSTLLPHDWGLDKRNRSFEELDAILFMFGIDMLVRKEWICSKLVLCLVYFGWQIDSESWSVDCGYPPAPTRRVRSLNIANFLPPLPVVF